MSKKPKYLSGLISTFHSSFLTSSRDCSRSGKPKQALLSSYLIATFTIHFKNPFHLMLHKRSLLAFKDNTP